MKDAYAIASVVPSDETRWSETVITPEPWVQDALCTQVDPDLFFPEGKGGSTAEAKKVCASCDVRLQCLDYATRTRPQHGVWGGLSQVELLALRSGAS